MDQEKNAQVTAKPIIASEPPKNIANYMLPAVLVAVFCCLPIGIIALVYAAEVNKAIALGDQERAIDASIKAKKWCTWGLAAFLFLLIGGIIMVLFE
jgi:hypothetical protein